MMSQDQTLANLKKDVRSLLLSTKLGRSVEQLKRDYEGMLGHCMPLKDLGFRSILDMAKEMPDVVSFSYLADGSLVLKAVTNESTHGIEELVSRQRVTKAKKRGGYHRSFPRPVAPVILPRWGRAAHFLPAQLRAQLRQLLSQGPLRLSELESRYQQCFGRPLRCTDYGFYSVGDLLSRMLDRDFSIQHTRMGSVLSLKQPEQPQPQSIPQPPRTGPVKPGAIRPTPICLSSSSEPKTGPLRPEPDSAPGQCSPSQSITQNSSVPSCKSLDPGSTGSQSVPDNGPPPQPPDQDAQLLKKFMFKLEAEFRQKILENGDAGSVNPELKAKLQKVVGDHSQGLSVHDLPTHYERVFGEELPVQQSGFLSVTELVAALSDIFHLEPAGGTHDHHWIVKNITSPSHTESAEHFGEEGKQWGSSLYQATKLSLWEQHDDDEEEEEEEEDQPDPTTCVTSSLSTQQLLELYPVVRVRAGSMVPLDAVRGQRLRPPTRRWPRALAAVLVEQVESPGSFHVRFSESQEARSLEDMMMEMRSCYTYPEVSERYRLPERYLRRGQVCCVSPRDLWFYRVVVQRMVSPDQVEVYYVDFGDVTLVPTDKLMFLKACYFQLPAQAVPAMLTGVQPISGVWSAAATASFQELCSNRTLVAALHGYHGDALQLFLCDTHTQDDHYVHTILQAQGHARPCPPPSTVTAGFACDCLKSLYLEENLIDLEEEEENMTTSTTRQPITGQRCQSGMSPGWRGSPVVRGSRPGPRVQWRTRDPPVSPVSLNQQRTTGPLICPPAPPPHCNGNHADTRTRPEEKSRPSVYSGPAVALDPCRVPVTSLSPAPPSILTSLSRLTPKLAKGGFYGNHTHTHTHTP
ncbi:Tudor domain-containing protein 5 [Merluccius polli]|uniref:Tudor domain-containing protein 5 n=1 Tax=Merluccius polli TaxID=89951 RepID=A0AA47N9Z9_MERPO|nr:Tudor domain-containing protein 5 [Merluccius polli]